MQRIQSNADTREAVLLRSLYAEDRCDDESDLKICIVRTEGNVVILKASMMLEIVHLGRKLNQNSYLTEERNGDSMNVLTKAGQRLQDKSFWGGIPHNDSFAATDTVVEFENSREFFLLCCYCTTRFSMG